MKPTRNRHHYGWKIAVAVVLCMFGMGLTAQPANAWAVGRAGIYNMGTVGIGVVHDWPDYDAILPPGYSTSGLYGWFIAKGFYVGAGWCTNYYVSAAGGNDSTGLVYVYKWTVRGPTYASKVWADDGAVYSYRC